MANFRIEFEKITGETFDDLKSLVLEQARHHDSAYRGDDAEFVKELGRENPVAQVLMVRDDDTREPLGYILFNHLYGFKGQELYIEDILVSDKQRSQGLGLGMTEVLKEQARHLGAEGISWTVAENNPAAIRFYEKKMHAHPKPCGVYDCGHLFAAPPAEAKDYEVRKVDPADLALLESQVGRLPGLDAQTMANIRAAVSAEHAEVYVALSNDGVPKALGITNANYSTFRTVYGYKFELMELTSDAGDAAGAFHALTAAVAQEGRATAHDGHLNIYIDKASEAQKRFIAELGAAPLQMTDDPASVFLSYGLGRDDIYGPAPKIPAPEKKPPSPAGP